MRRSSRPGGDLTASQMNSSTSIFGLSSLAIELKPVGGGTRFDWMQTFEDPAVAAALEHIVVPANEQNLDRLGAALTDLGR